MGKQFDYRKKKVFVCDFDGTVFLGNSPIPKAIQFIRREMQNREFYFLTNNTSRLPEDYLTKLHRVGIDVCISHVLTPHAPLVRYIEKARFSSVYLVASKRVKEFLQAQLAHVMLDFDFERNEALALTYDTELDYKKLTNASVLLNNKSAISYLATHTDMVCPSETGPLPDIGTFIAMLKSTTGRSPDTDFGKPNIELISPLLEMYGADCIAVVGDRLYTDKLLADRAGCDFVCVLSGEACADDLKELPCGELQPAAVVDEFWFE